MKKFLLSFFCLISFMTINANEATITFSEQGYTNQQEVTSVTLDGYIALTFDKGTNTNAPKYYTTGTALRIYGGGTMTVTGNSEAITINSITLTTGSGSYVVNSASTASEGTLAIDGTTATISDVNANSTIFTQGGSSGHVRILTVTVDYTIGTATKMSIPTISPTSGEIAIDTEISITCVDEANIYYTIDGSEPNVDNGTLYNAPFTLSADATVKAVAVDPNGILANSSVAEATYTVYAYSEYSYQLVTSVEDGGHYIVVGEKDGNYFAMGAKREGKNNRESIDVTLDENGIIANPSEKVSEIELQNSEGTWNLYSPLENAFLYNDDGGANKLILSPEVNDLTKATITFDSATSAAIITFINVTGATPDSDGVTTQSNIIRFNSSSSIFSCYKGTQQPVYLYQRVGDVPTSVEETLVNENAPVEYYNLQGVKVENPENGIFIKKQGIKATKVIL